MSKSQSLTVADLFDDERPSERDELVAEYLRLTREVMPKMARTSHKHWPVREDHCFQRIVLDAVCGDVWYRHLKKPAYKYLQEGQAQEAVQMCGEIISGEADLDVLNAQSLRFRSKAAKSHA
ncbi:MAG: hypothetical protein AAGI92_00995 [Pseudomonadota bacterium]